MKLDTGTDGSIVSYSTQDVVQQSFQIAMNAKAFHALSDALYKNKIGSIVREISCNALDSHIQAKKPEAPFEIHIPDIYEPYFHVRDFGVGLSPEDIASVYTTMFKSTKDESNDQIGCFGIGSKVPMSYTDSFSVTSIYNGIKYFYSVFKNEHGIPSILLLDKAPTDEGNGVEVKIPVESYDFQNFRKEVANQLRFLPVKPTFINGSITFNESFNTDERLILKTDNARILKDKTPYELSDYASSSNYFAVLGVIGYPIELESIKGITKVHKDFIHQVQGRVALYFNIGDIEVTASREGIQYTNKTCQALLSKIDKAREELLSEMLTKVNLDGLSNWDKAVALNEFTGFTSILIKSKYSIPNTVIGNNNETYAIDMFAIPIFDSEKARNWRLVSYKLTDNTQQLKTNERGIRNLTPLSKTVVFVRHDNIDKTPIKKIKHFALQNPSSIIYVLESMGCEFTDDVIKTFSDGMGGYKLLNISDLPDPPKVYADGARGPRGGYKIAKGYRINNAELCRIVKGKRLNDETSTKVYDDLEDIEPSFYVNSENGVIETDKCYKRISTYHLSNTMEMLNAIKKFYALTNRKFPDIYAFNDRSLAKIKVDPEWNHIDTFIQDFLDELASYKKIVAKTQLADLIIHLLDRWIDSTHIEYLIRNENLKKLNKKLEVTKLLRLYRISKKFRTNDKINFITSELSGFFAEDTTFKSLLDNIKSTIEVGTSKYKFLAYLRHSYGSIPQEDIDHTINYINCMGNS